MPLLPSWCLCALGNRDPETEQEMVIFLTDRDISMEGTVLVLPLRYWQLYFDSKKKEFPMPSLPPRCLGALGNAELETVIFGGIRMCKERMVLGLSPS